MSISTHPDNQPTQLQASVRARTKHALFALKGLLRVSTLGDVIDHIAAEALVNETRKANTPEAIHV